MMKHLLVAAAALAGGLVSCLGPASAYYVRGPEAPWCAVVNTGTGNVVWDCSYGSIEACRPNVIAGNRGFCNLNPAYRGAVVVEQRRHSRRHVHRY
jgi:hypothetical protein